MLKLQVMALTAFVRARADLEAGLRRRLADESGEITSTVALIGVLVVGALAAGAIVVTRMQNHARAIPNPGATPTP